MARSDRLLELAGLVTWGIIGIPRLLWLLAEPHRFTQARAILWLLGFAVYGFTFWLGAHWWLASRAGRRAFIRRRHAFLLAIQSLALIVMTLWGGTGFEVALLAVIAGQAPFVLRRWAAVAWVLAQGVIFIVIMWSQRILSPTVACASIGFQLFALGAAYLAESEAQARRELGRLNAELLRAQRLLAENSRMRERLRISRDLHDSLGHHLTALGLNLELAQRRLSQGDAAEYVARARNLNQLLLGDVRTIVSTLREDGRFNLRAAIEALVSAIPEPRILVKVPEELRIDDAATAQTLFHCLQEIVTNTVRHARAQNLWIDCVPSGTGVELHARDDGHVERATIPGLGLTGMSERLRQLGGRLDIEAEQGRSFKLRVWMPLSGAAP